MEARLSSIRPCYPETLPAFSLHGVTYMQQWVWCGKRRCRTCPHGPYWYAFYARPSSRKVTTTRRGRHGRIERVVTTIVGGTGHKYIGKRLPPSILEAFRVAAETTTLTDAEVARLRRQRRRR